MLQIHNIMKPRKTALLVAVAVAALFGFGNNNAYADSCDAASQEAAVQVDRTINAKVSELNATLAALGPVNNPQANALKKQISKAIAQIEANRGSPMETARNKARQECKDHQAPLQAAVDIGVTYAMGGLNLLLPPNAWHIDVGDVFKNPMGGKCSFVRNPLQHGCR